MTIALMLVGMLALAVLNVPIAIALGLVAMIAIWATQGSQMLVNTALVMFDGASSFPLLAIPLFILAGAIMNASSISRRLIAFASALVGFIRGGLSMVSIGASMFFAEISGSAVADVAALGTILIPAMRNRGYTKELAAATVSSAASLAIIIPPSIPMILYAVMAQTSVVKLFVAGILPGIIGGVGLALAAYWQAVRYHLPIEERFQLWRYRHMMTVMRIIGFKHGTGGSSGVPFLRRALETRFFPELWDVRTELAPPQSRRPS